ncbi:MAG: hypothetical protein FWD77_11120 [Betaproteobacteria bacterium]|nr:hypothetical protein [Betaproteobacteria bacterium]
MNGPLSATSLTVSGGNGGSAAINIFSSPADSGGDAGLGGAGGIQGQNGSGGGGGDATLNATGQTVTVTGALTVSSGAAGGAQANGYGAGGDATFIAGTLIAPTMTLTKNDGAISVAVDTLNVNQNTTITVEGTAAADVVIDTVNVAAGQTLTIASLNSGELTINHLNIAPQPQPPAPPVPPPIPTPDPAFSDGDTLSPGNRYTAPAGNSSFCLGGNPGSAPVTIRIDNVPYTITPEAENTCFEIFSAGSGRALILDSGTAEIGTIVPGAALLEARNGDLVVDDSHTGSTSATIRAMLDPVCTSTRITVLEGTVSAPDWIKSPMPASGCPADALTPGKGNFMVSNGKLACPPSSLEIKGNWAKLTVKHTQNLNAGQQVFDVATYGGAWFQNAPHGWAALGESFEPVDSATESGQRTTTLVNGLDVRGIPGTELYTGHGANADEMMMNGRYCGVFRVAP